jgi:hypothetical protein
MYVGSEGVGVWGVRVCGCASIALLRRNYVVEYSIRLTGNERQQQNVKMNRNFERRSVQAINVVCRSDV